MYTYINKNIGVGAIQFVKCEKSCRIAYSTSWNVIYQFAQKKYHHHINTYVIKIKLINNKKKKIARLPQSPPRAHIAEKPRNTTFKCDAVLVSCVNTAISLMWKLETTRNLTQKELLLFNFSGEQIRETRAHSRRSSRK